MVIVVYGVFQFVFDYCNFGCAGCCKSDAKPGGALFAKFVFDF